MRSSARGRSEKVCEVQSHEVESELPREGEGVHTGLAVSMVIN